MTCKSIFRKVFCSVFALLLVCNLTGCMLLPTEEEDRMVTYVHADELPQYTFTSPSKMDIEKIVDIACTYRQLEEEDLSFNLDNQVINQVFVKEGDIVNKGDLLATLQAENMDEEIKNRKDTIDQAERGILAEKQAAEFQKQQLKVDYKYDKITKQEYKNQVAEINKNLKSSLKAKEDDIYIQKLRLKEQEKTNADCKIYAPIDGKISFVKQDVLYSLSKKGVPIIKMINPEKCAFEIFKSADAEILKEGQEYTVDCDGKNYTGKLKPIEDDRGYIYLQLNKVPTDLEVGTNGAIHCVAGTKKNVLGLPAAFVHETNGDHFVYIEDEKKVKVIKKIEVGIMTTENVEITGGLTENDLIIQE